MILALLAVTTTSTRAQYLTKPGSTHTEVVAALSPCSDSSAYVILLHSNAHWPEWFHDFGKAMLSMHPLVCGYTYSGDPAVHAAFGLIDGVHVTDDRHLPALFMCGFSNANGHACARPQDAITSDDIPAWKSMELEPEQVAGFSRWLATLLQHSGRLFEYVKDGPHDAGTNAKAIPLPDSLLVDKHKRKSRGSDHTHHTSHSPDAAAGRPELRAAMQKPPKEEL